MCSFCRSTLLRDGDTLRRIGVSAELFDDHSPLQLGVSGQHQGLAFTLVGRLQYSYAEGTWNEWHALFDGAANSSAAPRSAWLSEDNGAYVLAFDAALPAELQSAATALQNLRPGQTLQAEGRSWSVASVQRAQLLAAQGELPRAPRLDGEFTVVDLRNAQGEVATLDDVDTAHPSWSVGRSVVLSALRLSGLKDGPAEATLAARTLQCPSCGAGLVVKLDSTRSISCTQCNAVVDLGTGAGAGVAADLAHFAQNNSGSGAGAEPQIALGRTGTLALDGTPLPWQVVGYQERCDIPDSGDDETTFWREYLLYNRSAGFAFLVDSNEGWSAVKPLTGVPTLRADSAVWQAANYRKRDSYAAKVTWVQGEFYWRVRRDEKTLVTDFEGQGADANKRLSREQSGSEITWSAGQTLTAAEVAEAFSMAPEGRTALQRDATPLSGHGSALRIGVIILVLVVLALLVSQCSSRNPCDTTRNTFGAASAEYQQCVRNSGRGARTGGGSYGGWSSGGGGHK